MPARKTDEIADADIPLEVSVEQQMVPNSFHYLPKQVEDRQFLDRLSADNVRTGEVDASDARAQQRGAQLVE